MVAVRVPLAPGVNVITTTHVPPLGPTVASTVQVVPVVLKSPGFVPPGANPEMTSVPLPRLVRVTVMLMLVVPTICGLNITVVVVRLATAAFTVIMPGSVFPLGSVAVMVTVVFVATGKVVTANVPVVAPPGKLNVAITEATPVLLLPSATVKPAAGDGPFSVTVPVEPLPADTAAGLNVTETITAAFTVSVPVAMLAPSVAVTVTGVLVATPTVVAVNVAVFVPPVTVTFMGTVAAGLLLPRVTVRPAAGALALSVTVPVELVPPVTVAGLNATLVTVGGSTVNVAVTMTVPVVAVQVIVVPVLTELAVTMNVCEVAPAATATLDGAGNAAGLVHISPTLKPRGAGPFSVTVPVVACPEPTLFGLYESCVTTGGTTVNIPLKVFPLGRVAVMLAVIATATEKVVTVKVPLVAPPAMLKDAGTDAAAEELLISVTVSPAAGACPLSVTVPVLEVPPVTVEGFRVTELITAGSTVKVPIAVVPERLAVTVTGVTAATPVVVAVKI